MKLIKCRHCGRPFYDENEACPYCGHALDSSSNNNPNESNLSESNSNESNHNESNLSESNSNESNHNESNFSENNLNESTQPEQSSVLRSQTSVSEPFSVPSRADAIAALTSTSQQNEAQPDQIQNENYDPNQIETTLPPRRKHTLLWIAITLLIIASAAAVYFFPLIKQMLK